MKKWLKIVCVLMAGMLIEIASAAEGWDLISAYYKSVGVTSRSYPAVVDIDNDNDQDFVIGQLDGTLSFFRNDGTNLLPSFNLVDTAYASSDVGSYSAPAFADIDGDNDQDLFVGNSLGTISYYRNDGTALAPVYNLVDANYFQIDIGFNSAPAFADIDGDNDQDLFVGNSLGTISFYRNDGTALAAYWTLANAFYDSIDVGSYSAPTFVDIDGDKDQDLFVGNSGGSISFYRNDGTTLAPAWKLIDATYFLIDVGSYSVPAFADINGDLDFDLFIGASGGNLNFHRNEGTAQSQYFATISVQYSAISTGTYSAPTLVDIDKDGDLDMFIGGNDGTLLFFRNKGTTKLPAWSLESSSFQSIDVGDRAIAAFADIDGDLDNDLFIGNTAGTIGFYRNNGTAQAPSFSLVDAGYFQIDVGSNSAPVFVDIDGDNDQDLFIGNSSGTITFYRNDGTALSPYWNLVTASYNSIDAGFNSVPLFADIDGDLDYDLFIGESNGRVHFYFNNGTALAPDMVNISTYYGSIDIGSYSSLALGDLDGDNDLDMLIGKSDGYLAFYRNNAVLDYLYWIKISSYYLSIDVGSYANPTFVDIDGDNDQDLFVGNSGGTIWFYRNDGTAQAPAATLITTYYDSIDVGTYSAPAFVDIDGDNDYDMIAGQYDGALSFYRNDGTALSPSWNLLDNTYFNIDVGTYSAPAFVDIDKDNDYDMLIGGYDGRIWFYRNEGTAISPYWKQESVYYAAIDVGYNSNPAFFDIDNDGDYDMFIGERDGYINFYRKNSTAQVPNFTLETSSYNTIDVGTYSAPTFADIDGDNNIGLFAGDNAGRIHYWETLNKITLINDSRQLVTKSKKTILMGTSSNPFSYTTAIGFKLHQEDNVSLAVYDLMGNKVAHLINEKKLPGTYTTRFDAGHLPNGIYVFTLRIGTSVQTGKMIKGE